MGKHTIKHWSSTQTSISLSSGEAEFAGVIRGAGQGLGYQALLRDVGVELPLRVWTDSSAAIGICSRQGLGKLRHLDTHTLWIQQAVRTKRVDLRKVDGECNPADILTKHSISRQRLESLIALYGCKYLGGRAESAPQLREGDSSKKTMASAGGEISGIEDPRPAEEHGSGTAPDRPPIMPHLTYPSLELDRLYPSIETPDDDQLDDLVDDSADIVYQKGLRITAEIRAETTSQGRRRRPTLASLRRDIGDALDISRRRSTANPASINVNTTGLATTTTAWTTASSSTTRCAATTTTPATPRSPCATTRFRRRNPSPSRSATSTEHGRHLSSLRWRTRPSEGRPFAGGVRRLGALSASPSASVALAQDTFVSSLTAPDSPTHCCFP